MPSTPAPEAPASLSVHPARNVSGPAPAVLVLPGGSYVRQADHEAEPVADVLAGWGLHAFVLRYPVAPERFPAALIHAKQAMAWIRSGNSGPDVAPHRVGVLGFSAGGHLAASLANDALTGDAGLDAARTRPDLAVLGYPVISFLSDVHQGSIDALLGASADAAKLSQHSAELHVTPDNPPTFLWHTADDEAVPATNSVAYSTALMRAGVPVELHLFSSGRHGLGLAPEHPAAAWVPLCRSWLAGRGWLPTPAPASASAPAPASD
jgi:acetyl esterase/lipase